MNETIQWLLDGDPAVAWQVQRDLLGRATSTWQATRRRVATLGWGAQLLSHRSPDGMWGDGLYGPKWTGTFYTLRLLMQLGLPPSNRKAVASCRLLIDRGVTDLGGVSLWSGDWTDTCVTGMLLEMACYFGFASDERVHSMAAWLLADQMSDGGWNCNRIRPGAKHSSFHSTISTLEGLTAFDVAKQSSHKHKTAIQDGQEFFLRHQLYRSCRTGEIIKPSFAKFSFPPHWYFDALRGLEYFSNVGAAWDDRLADPVAVLKARKGKDGRWKAQNKHTGRTFFGLEEARHPSRINTLRALRVLRWLKSSQTIR